MTKISFNLGGLKVSLEGNISVDEEMPAEQGLRKKILELIGEKSLSEKTIRSLLREDGLKVKDALVGLVSDDRLKAEKISGLVYFSLS